MGENRGRKKGQKGTRADLPAPMVIMTRVRRSKVAEMLLTGFTSVNQIAVRLNVAHVTVGKDISVILREWSNQDAEEFNFKRSKRIKQLESIFQKAMASYQRSRQDQEELTTVCNPKKCDKCKDGMIGENLDEWCSACDGKGETMVEVTTRRIKGQAGDSSFLKAANECVREAAKLEGLYEVEKKNREEDRPQEAHLHLHGAIDLSGVPAEKLLEAKEVLMKLSHDLRSSGRTIIESEMEERKDD